MKELDKANQEHVLELLRQASVARDSLPYTDEFASLKRQFFDRSLKNLTDEEFWGAIVAVAKKGGVTGKPRTKEGPDLGAEERELLKSLLPVPVGEIDRLPYTNRFDKLVARFNSRINRGLSKREIWLAVLRLRK